MKHDPQWLQGLAIKANTKQQIQYCRNVEVRPATEVIVSLKMAASRHMQSSYLQLIRNAGSIYM
jgi:hypothetical protein